MSSIYRDPAPASPVPPSPLFRLFGAIGAVVTFLFRAVVVLFFLVGLGLFWVAVSGGGPAVVEDNVALVIAPTGELVERVDQDPVERWFEEWSGELPSQTDVRRMVEAIDHARDDARINFLALKLDGVAAAGFGHLEEIGAAIDRFKAAGKPVYVYGAGFDQGQYGIAAHATEISLDPLGSVWLEGLSAYTNFFKEGLDKLALNVHVFRVGEYKSAVEPFLRNDMSAEAKAANGEWLGDLWHRYEAVVGEQRGGTPAMVGDYVRNLTAAVTAAQGDSAKVALDGGLVNRIETLTAFRTRMGERVGMDEDDHGSFRQIHHHDYLRAIDHERRAEAGAGRKQIALVVVQGEIVDGYGEVGTAGGDTIGELLEQARRDDEVAAVVLRVDSPGGSVFASERIRREVQQLQAADKPVIASMASVAASGGYWVAMDADRIFAYPTTITGSIGIFGVVFTLEDTLAKLGIHTDGVGTTPLAGAFRADRPLAPEVQQLIQAEIDRGYRVFIEGVARGRELDVARVEEIARGRVWSGEDARGLGLVDELGGLQAAVEAAAGLASLGAGEYELVPLEASSDFPGQVLVDLAGRAGAQLLPPALRQAGAAVDLPGLLRRLNDPQGRYAHCQCQVERRTGMLPGARRGAGGAY